MPQTVCIEVSADGQLSVGIEPDEGALMGMGGAGGDMGAPGMDGKVAAPAMMGDQQEDKSYLKPAANVDEALQMARQLLEQVMGGQPGPGENQMAQGFNKVRGAM